MEFAVTMYGDQFIVNGRLKTKDELIYESGLTEREFNEGMQDLISCGIVEMTSISNS
jgi:hypothetical protein